MTRRHDASPRWKHRYFTDRNVSNPSPHFRIEWLYITITGILQTTPAHATSRNDTPTQATEYAKSEFLDIPMLCESVPDWRWATEAAFAGRDLSRKRSISGNITVDQLLFIYERNPPQPCLIIVNRLSRQGLLKGRLGLNCKLSWTFLMENKWACGYAYYCTACNTISKYRFLYHFLPGTIAILFRGVIERHGEINNTEASTPKYSWLHNRGA